MKTFFSESGLQGENVRKNIFILGIVLLSLLSGVMILLTPSGCVDDGWYLVNSEGTPGSWKYFYTTFLNCIDHWTFDTGRLGNTVSSLFLALFPRWVYALLTAGMIFIIYFMAIKIVRIGWISTGSALWVLLISFGLPWFEYMYTIVYSINYLWSSALGLLVLYLYIYNPKSRLSTGSALLLFLLGLVTGWWHEGLSAPLALGLVVYSLVEWRRLSRSQLMIFIGLLAGMCAIFCMPAFWNMTGERESFLIKTTKWETLINVFAFDCCWYIFLILLLVLSCIRRCRERLWGTRRGVAMIAFYLSFGLASEVLYVLYFNGARTGIFTQIFCGIGILYLLEHYSVCRFNRSGAVICGVVFLLSLGSLLRAIYVQTRLSAEYELVQSMVAKEQQKSGRRIVFFNPSPISVGLDGMKPSYMLLNTKYGMGDVKILPAELAAFECDSSDISPCSDPNLILYHGCLVYKGNLVENDSTRYDVILQDCDGNKIYSRTRIRAFVTGKGDSVSYVQPHSVTVNKDMKIVDAVMVKP